MATLAEIIEANPDSIFPLTEDTFALMLASITHGPCSVCGLPENVLWLTDHFDLCYSCMRIVS